MRPAPTGKFTMQTAMPKDATPAFGSRAGYVAAKAVGSFVPRLTRKAFEKYGFSAAALLTDWADIVGPRMAAFTMPERLKWPRSVDAYGGVEAGGEGRPGATLMLKVDGGRALDIEYGKRELIERINRYFGYRAVAELRILQAPVTAMKPRDVLTTQRRHAPRPLPSTDLSGITDTGLRAALERMRVGIASARSR